jgi:hypothetical protein
MRSPSLLVAALLTLMVVGCGSQERLASSCHPSYPDICIWVADDLRCEDITSGTFRYTDDPYELDRNGDGFACGPGDREGVVGP